MKFKFFTFLSLSMLFLSFAYAQEYRTWHLPEGATMRIGKGKIGGFAFSRDGNELAVSSSTGIWIYSVATGDELAMLTGHTAQVDTLVFSPDGEILASVGLDRTTRLWDTESGAQLAILRHRQSSHALIVFSPDGNTIVSGNWNGTIQTWNATTGKHLATLNGHTGSIKALALSPDGKTLASASESQDTAIRLWDIRTEEHLSTLEKRHEQPVGMLAFSPDGKTLASTTRGDGAAIQLWDVAAQKNLFALTGHKQRVSVLTFSPDGKILASAGMGGTVRLWNPETGKQVHALVQLGLTHTGQQVLTATRRTAWIDKLVFSPDGSVLVSSDRHGTVQMWNVAAGKSISAWKAHTRSIRALAFSTDKPIFMTVDEKGTLHSWHAATGAPSAALTLNGHEDYGWGSALGFSADRKMLRAGSGSTIRSWDTKTGRMLEPITLQASVASALGFSPNGKTLASVGYDKPQVVQLWDLPAGIERATLIGHTWAVETLAFSQDSGLLATGGREGTIHIWDVETGHRKKTLKGHQISVKALAFSPDGTTLASASHRDIRLWDIDTGDPHTTLIAHEDSGQADTLALAFSPDGKMLASAMRGKLSLSDAHTHRLLSEIVGDSARINVLRFSPDSAILLTGHGNGTIQMWDMDTYALKTTIKPHTGRIEVLKFSPDGRTLATGSTDGTILLWHWASLTPRKNRE